MKKLLSLVLALSALAGTASAAPYYLSRPASGELTPNDWLPVYSVDGIYNWTSKHSAPDTAGARFNLSLYSSGNAPTRHQFSLSVGYEGGNRNYTEDFSHYKMDIDKKPITLAYDLNVALSDYILFDIGLRGGYAFGHLETLRAGFKDSSTSTGGFTYGLTAGLKVQCSQNIYVKLAYEFTRTYYSENLSRDLIFNQHGIVLGVGCTF